MVQDSEIITKASVVTKTEFPSLELYDKLFLPSHFIISFRKAGLQPLNRWTISSNKLSKSIPFTGELSQQWEAGSQDNMNACQAMVSHTMELLLIWTTMKGSTPIQLQLCGYFKKLFTYKKRNHAKWTDKRKIKVSFLWWSSHYWWSLWKVTKETCTCSQTEKTSFKQTQERKQAGKKSTVTTN